MKPVSIRTTIFLALLATSLIGIILSSFFIYQDSSRIIKRQAEQYYNAETKNIENRLEQHISLLLSQLNRVSKNSLLINALIDETGREQYLPQFLHSISFSKNFSQVDLSFHDFELTLIESNHKNRALLWYTLNNKNSISNSVFKRKKTYLSFQKSIQQKNLLVIAIPVFYENLPEGALVAAFSWKHIWKDLLEGKQHLAMQALFKDQIISKSGNNTTEGVVKTVQIITIPNLKISITIPSNLLKDPIREMLQILLIRSFPILIILILITTFLLSRKITQPLIYFTSITSQIAKGNWKKVHLTGANTELTALAKSFNRMISALEHSHNNVEDSYQKLEEEKKKQLKQAYVAGITENAISVLHNIGNAITPAVVNIQEMLDFKNSLEIKHFFIKIHNIIEKALEEGRIETLFTEDPSGKQILPFLQEMGEMIKSQTLEEVSKLSTVNQQLMHISSIISLQQQYANFQGVIEKIEIKTLITDAIQMMAPALKKRNIQIDITADPSIPLIELDQNKLIQVLLNILKNSMESIQEKIDLVKPFEPKIQIQLHNKNDTLYFYCSDNGIGIDSLHLDSIFQFGYTTKNKGSGFGLHDCANFIRLNKGTIQLASKGKEHGATLSFTLPTKT